MRYIDLHCDTLMLHMSRKNTGDLYSNKIGSVDFKRLREGAAVAQFFAIYIFPENEFAHLEIEPSSTFEYVKRAAKYLHNNLNEYKAVAGLATNGEELEDNEKENRVSAFLTIENGEPVNGKMENIKYFYELGVRLITLTWNYENCFGFPNSTNYEKMQLGLKPFGKEAVEYMNELGIIIDVSHLSDGGFYDVLEISKKPVMASHSNARALTNHPRNLTDDMIKRLADSGGVSGLNFASDFLKLGEKLTGARLSSMIAHLDYMKDKGGEEFPALGSDLDGIDQNGLEICDSTKFGILFDGLKSAGWSERQIEKVAYKNAKRVINEVM
ncbi:MAG: peptidase [Treponema sp.]|nr:MAG: peptidase [Treponema sp.]